MAERGGRARRLLLTKANYGGRSVCVVFVLTGNAKLGPTCSSGVRRCAAALKPPPLQQALAFGENRETCWFNMIREMQSRHIGTRKSVRARADQVGRRQPERRARTQRSLWRKTAPEFPFQGEGEGGRGREGRGRERQRAQLIVLVRACKRPPPRPEMKVVAGVILPPASAAQSSLSAGGGFAAARKSR